MSAGCVVIAAGGTGGHMFAAIATARALEELGATPFFLTDRRGARFLGDADTACIIDAASPSGGLRAAIGAVRSLVAGTLQSRAVWRRERPRAVAAFGGYASIPAAIAARLARTPIVLHEQNAHLGRANKFLARFAKILALSFEKTRNLRAGVETVVTGNPVRPGFAELAWQGAVNVRADAAADRRVRLLIFGGSQGARVLSDEVPRALGLLEPALRDALEVTQQARPEDEARVRDAYAALGIEATVRTFFDDLPARMAASDLVIARAGASTIAELLALAKPAILVPYPFAADDHQTANARALEEQGAALCMPQNAFDAAALAAALSRLLADPGALGVMASACRRLARPHAARDLAWLVARAGGIASGPEPAPS